MSRVVGSFIATFLVEIEVTTSHGLTRLNFAYNVKLIPPYFTITNLRKLAKAKAKKRSIYKPHPFPL